MSGALDQPDKDRPHFTIAHVDPERRFGGGQVQLFLLMERLSTRRHASVLVCPARSRSATEAQRRGSEAVPVRMRNEIDVPSIVRLYRLFRERQVDIVHLHTGRANWLGGIAAWMAR